ncbi:MULTISPECIES: amino acid ABC transporter permease [unclassified Microbacterium]|uniref:amino acid ABC transporter permease n=1 Tax=unclassified Microbacterium TaxID=2609290 RepID=UPI00214C5847|nr:MULTISPECIES: amino acid ABC transporter permease [unclassified Microbacterium]MCR2786115.1 amino acid ABC transporter permease [Microbacterium sp. zg.B96]WIM17028.1 amino acid ABC transporter permease [Microbacterium sp. zg-B96]
MTDVTTRPLRNPHADRSIDAANARRRIHPWRVVAGLAIILVTAQILHFLITNERFDWPVVWEYLFNPSVLMGLGMSIMLTVVGMVLGSILGTMLAAGQLSSFAPVKWFCIVFVGFFRGVPPLVQLIFWYNLAYLLPRIALGVPFGPELLSWPTNDVITPLTAAIIGLSLHEAAYMAEIVRAGIISVDSGQRDAASAMGFSRWHAFSRVVLPQAMRVIIPPTGSQVIALLKGTSLVSVIAMGDLLHSVQVIYNRTYEVVPMLLVAVIWYLVVVTLLTIVQRRVEGHFSRGMSRTARARRTIQRIEEPA